MGHQGLGMHMGHWNSKQWWWSGYWFIFWRLIGRIWRHNKCICHTAILYMVIPNGIVNNMIRWHQTINQNYSMLVANLREHSSVRFIEIESTFPLFLDMLQLCIKTLIHPGTTRSMHWAEMAKYLKNRFQYLHFDTVQHIVFGFGVNWSYFILDTL